MNLGLTSWKETCKETGERTCQLLENNQSIYCQWNQSLRIYSAVSLLFKDYTIEEIAKELHSTVDIIYDDLTVRLPRIEASPEILEQVKKSMPFIENDISQDVKDVLSKHKMGNLINQEGNGPYFDSNYFKENQVERNEDGTFKSFPRKK